MSGLPAAHPDPQRHEGRAELVRRELDPPERDHGVHGRLGLLQGPAPARNRLPSAQGRARAPSLGHPAVGAHRLRQPQHLAPWHLPRRQLQAPPALPRRVQRPL